MTASAAVETVPCGFGIYIHWPFCLSKCPYCDFNSHVSSHIDQRVWTRAYLSEIDRLGAETPGRIVGSVFFGGGTPSLMDASTVAAILERIGRTWRIANDLEVTLEANPTSVEAGRFQGYRDAGVTRVSIGIQALNDPDLARLGRRHTATEARASLKIARETFDRVSFDLIYARQDQSLSAWRSELGDALDLAVDHLSLYQLTVEDGTAFGARYRAGTLRGLPSDDLSADLYALTQEMCDAAGLPAYEVSNHARKDAQSRHNLVYWRGGDWCGIGPGAHGRLTLDGTRLATDTPLAPQAWLGQVARTGSGETTRTVVAKPEQAEEYLMMSLRLAEGLDLTRYSELAGRKLSDRSIERLVELGHLARKPGLIAATASGRMVLNALIRELLFP